MYEVIIVISDLYEEILKPNQSHTNRIIQVVPCKTVFTVPYLKKQQPEAEMPTFKNQMQVKREFGQAASQPNTLSTLSGVQG